jgi:hypothetical protein
MDVTNSVNFMLLASGTKKLLQCAAIHLSSVPDYVGRRGGDEPGCGDE